MEKEERINQDNKYAFVFGKGETGREGGPSPYIAACTVTQLCCFHCLCAALNNFSAHRSLCHIVSHCLCAALLF